MNSLRIAVHIPLRSGKLSWMLALIITFLFFSCALSWAPTSHILNFLDDFFSALTFSLSFPSFCLVLLSEIFFPTLFSNYHEFPRRFFLKILWIFFFLVPFCSCSISLRMLIIVFLNIIIFLLNLFFQVLFCFKLWLSYLLEFLQCLWGGHHSYFKEGT